MTDSTKPPVWFWIVSAVALIWNLLGVMAYLGQAFAPDQLDAATRDLVENRPAWATGAFAIAVWGGALGSLLLLLRRGLAHLILMASLAGVIVQMIYNLFIAKSPAGYGPGEYVMVIMVLGISIYLVLFAKKGKVNGWLS